MSFGNASAGELLSDTNLSQGTNSSAKQEVFGGSVCAQDHILETFFYIVPGWGLCVILYLRFIPPMANPILCAFCKQDYRRAWRGLARRQQWLSLNLRFFKFPSVSETRDRTCDRTPTSVTLAEKTNNSGDSLTGSVNMLALESYKKASFSDFDIVFLEVHSNHT
ncbi:hypothetical protein pdam_00010432 [Pocillopora damicornis]|uniref:Uncharacterized protein n=1 Tax=Pocillopora damicornis TaxID=46731 RepID=A0A3M6UA77_POCDA|nr:hypothetical protein pdam_00010432 [Pocillopora damicornis]